MTGLTQAAQDPERPPPAGDPWDLPVHQCPFAFLDLEMTGMDPARDAIVEVAVTRTVGGVVVGTLDTLVRTAVPSHPDALALHGLTHAMVGMAPAFADIAPTLAGLLHGAVPVAHGLSLDLAFLNRALAAAGSPSRVVHALDTVTLARRAINARGYGLGALCQRLGLPSRRWHRAGEDVLAVRDLFAAMVTALDARTARDLWEVRVGQGRVQPLAMRGSIVAAVNALAAAGRAGALVIRTPGKDPATLRGRVTRVGQHARVALAGGGVRLVRLDRVLRVEA